VNIAEQIALYRGKGFTSDHAEVITLMRLAAGVLFRAFPESFVLFGGATLLFFHDSVRHSGDLDLLSRTDERPAVADIETALGEGLASAADALRIAPLQFENVSEGDLDMKLWVKGRNGRRLLRVDLSRFGSVLESEIEEHEIVVDNERSATIKSASREFLLLQKAECFLLRRVIKVRDAFDIKLLANSGAVLGQNLKGHLSDILMSCEIEAEDITKRIEQVNEKRCRNELEPVLPGEAFESLARDGFKSLRDALYQLYAEWL
jgi:hypothetical protein